MTETFKTALLDRIARFIDSDLESDEEINDAMPSALALRLHLRHATDSRLEDLITGTFPRDDDHLLTDEERCLIADYDCFDDIAPR